MKNNKHNRAVLEHLGQELTPMQVKEAIDNQKQLLADVFFKYSLVESLQVEIEKHKEDIKQMQFALKETNLILEAYARTKMVNAKDDESTVGETGEKPRKEV